MSEERWLPVLEFEGHYEVSDRGRVRSLTRKVVHARSGQQTVRGRMLALNLDTHGYPRLMLRCDGKSYSRAVHRLVLSAFVPRPDWESMHVNHKDGVTTNNQLQNIEWCTPSENRAHSYRVLKRRNHMTGKTGARHHNAKPVIGRCIESGETRQYGSMAEVSRDGFSGSDVSACVLGEQKSHRGWLWRYASDPVPLDWRYEPTVTPTEKNVHAKPVERVSADGEVKRYAAAALARAEGFNPVGISHVLKGRARTHRGFVWRYAEGVTA